MTWTDPNGDLRRLLNDDAQGNLVKHKRIFPTRGGRADGRVSIFVTLEDRLVAPVGGQAGVSQPLRIFQQDPVTLAEIEMAASGIVVLDAVRGEFTLMGLAPSGVDLYASYYWQQFLDADLTFALQQAAQQCAVNDVTLVPGGLQLTALSIAAALAHRKAAQRWGFRKSEQFLLEDAPSQDQLNEMVTFHSDQATSFMSDGMATRTAYYKDRLGQAQQPAYGLLARAPRPYTPRR